MRRSLALPPVAVLAALLLVAACGAPAQAPPHDEGLPVSSDTAATLPVPLDGVINVDDGAPPVDEPVDEPPVDEPPVDEPPVDEPDEEPPVAVADCPRVRVVDTGGVVLNVRPDPSTAAAPVGTLAPGQIAEVVDVVVGQDVSGDTTWFEIDDGAVTGFISGAFATCVLPGAFDDEAYLLPVGCGAQVTVTQGNNTSFSHNGQSAYAFDFGLALNTPLTAVQRGVVIAVDEDTQPGDACYAGGDSGCIGEANSVTLRHPDGTTSIYAHVNGVVVDIGQQVARGDTVALSGGTGWSTGPHAHVARQTDCGYAFCQSVAMSFADVDGDGVPTGGDAVVSGNCP